VARRRRLRGGGGGGRHDDGDGLLRGSPCSLLLQHLLHLGEQRLLLRLQLLLVSGLLRVQQLLDVRLLRVQLLLHLRLQLRGEGVGVEFVGHGGDGVRIAARLDGAWVGGVWRRVVAAAAASAAAMARTVSGGEGLSGGGEGGRAWLGSKGDWTRNQV